MMDLSLIFNIGLKVKCEFDGYLYPGTVTQVYPSHIIVDVPQISDHCYYEVGTNINMVYPSYYC